MTWPMWTTRTLPWVSRSRGPRADRTLASYRAAVAPRIAHCTPALGESVQRAVEEASLALARFEGASTRGGTVLAPIADLLMRGEMVASSRIESVNAPLDMVAAASLGVRVHVNARLVAAAGDATRALSDVADRRHLEADDLLSAHRTLLAPLAADVEEQVGRLRSVQNWIGGSDYSPRGALHVPPPADEIAADVDDLIVFLRRQDLPALAQAAIAHAQFEGIHPFVDGNGRVGRALIHAAVRRRGLTRQVTVPVAAAMMAQGERYTRALDLYRAGDPDPIIELVAQSVGRATAAAQESSARILALPEAWRARTGARRGSAQERLLDSLLEHPVLDAEDAQALTGASSSATYGALDRLVADGVLRIAVARKRDRVWVAAAVIDEVEILLDALAE